MLRETPRYGDSIFYDGSAHVFGVVKMRVVDVDSTKGKIRLEALEQGPLYAVDDDLSSPWLHTSYKAALEHAIADLNGYRDSMFRRREQLEDDIAICSGQIGNLQAALVRFGA